MNREIEAYPGELRQLRELRAAVEQFRFARSFVAIEEAYKVVRAAHERVVPPPEFDPVRTFTAPCHREDCRDGFYPIASVRVGTPPGGE